MQSFKGKTKLTSSVQSINSFEHIPVLLKDQKSCILKAQKNRLLTRSSEDGPDCEMTMRSFMYGHGLGNLSVSFKVVIVYRSCFKVFLYMVNDGSFNDFQNHGHCDG